MEKLLTKKITALLPHYTKEGANYTKVKLLKEEEVLVQKSISSTLKTLCQFHHYDLKSSNKTSKEMLGIKKTPPIAISKDLVFIALKTRNPIGKDDGAYSYINIETISSFKDGQVEFENGDKLEVDCKFKTIEKNIKQAKLLKDIIWNRHEIGSKETLNSDLDKRIKRDLELVYKKIKEIEKILF